MITTMETMTKQQKSDIDVLARFVRLYCVKRHGVACRGEAPFAVDGRTLLLCDDCIRLMAYAVSKRLACPLEGEKPSCRRCRIHCYGNQERKKIREVMAFAGKRMIMSGRLDYLWKYLF
jgi:hypothetical protein